MNGTIFSDVKSKVVTWGNISNQGKVQKTQEQDCFSAVFDKTKNPAQENQSDTSAKTENTQKPVDIRETKASRQLKDQGEKAKAVKSEDVEETAGKMVEEIAKQNNCNEIVGIYSPYGSFAKNTKKFYKKNNYKIVKVKGKYLGASEEIRKKISYDKNGK